MNESFFILTQSQLVQKGVKLQLRNLLPFNKAFKKMRSSKSAKNCQKMSKNKTKGTLTILGVLKKQNILCQYMSKY